MTSSTAPVAQRGALRRRQGLQAWAAGLVVLLGTCGCAPHALSRTGGSVLQTAGAEPASASAAPGESAAPHDRTAISSPSPSSATDELAAAAVREFCRPELSQRTWIAALDPYLTLAAASVYATVQPSRVACTRLTGTPRAGEGDGFTRLVAVPTDAGVYRVTVTRTSPAERWLVFRIAPAGAR